MKIIPEKLSLEEEIYGVAPYIVSDSLRNAVEYAHLLKRPLFIRGEPGCGKTQFARLLALQLYKEDLKENYKDKYFEWFVKSTSKANDGLYRFDYLKRLQDAQLSKIDDSNFDVSNEKYLTMGELGKAFQNSKKGSPSILLIDEIDKADIDFPNDLLLELDQKRFFIPELDNKEEKLVKEIKAEEAPIIIITSNDERELPNAFLRRCVFCYINFPENEMLEKIITFHLKAYADKEKILNETHIKSIVSKFVAIYQKMKASGTKDKPVSTSELLDWVKAIYKDYVANKLTFDAEGGIILTKDVTDKDGKFIKKIINYPEILFKTLNDFNLFHAE